MKEKRGVTMQPYSTIGLTTNLNIFITPALTTIIVRPLGKSMHFTGLEFFHIWLQFTLLVFMCLGISCEPSLPQAFDIGLCGSQSLIGVSLENWHVWMKVCWYEKYIAKITHAPCTHEITIPKCKQNKYVISHHIYCIIIIIIIYNILWTQVWLPNTLSFPHRNA